MAYYVCRPERCFGNALGAQVPLVWFLFGKRAPHPHIPLTLPRKRSGTAGGFPAHPSLPYFWVFLRRFGAFRFRSLRPVPVGNTFGSLRGFFRGDSGFLPSSLIVTLPLTLWNQQRLARELEATVEMKLSLPMPILPWLRSEVRFFLSP